MKHEAIDSMMPWMPCDPGCGECCGVTPCSQPDYQRVEAYAARHGIVPRVQGLTCPWYHDGTCAVYAARPTACRVFGHTEDMVCPRGYNVNVTLTIERRIMGDEVAAMIKHGVRLLHEAIMSIEELEQVVIGHTINEGSYPSRKTYAAGRTLKMGGFGMKNTMFIDSKTGEVT